jgi:hypothetical protein
MITSFAFTDRASILEAGPLYRSETCSNTVCSKLLGTYIFKDVFWKILVHIAKTTSPVGSKSRGRLGVAYRLCFEPLLNQNGTVVI